MIDTKRRLIENSTVSHSHHIPGAFGVVHTRKKKDDYDDDEGRIRPTSTPSRGGKKKTNSSLRQLSYKRPPVRRITLQRDITFDRATSS